MEYDKADLGGAFMVNKIKSYKILYYKDDPKLIDEIEVTFEDGIVLQVDEGYLKAIQEALEKELVIDVKYNITARRTSWEKGE